MAETGEGEPLSARKAVLHRRFVRWQSYARGQLTVAVGAVFALALAGATTTAPLLRAPQAIGDAYDCRTRDLRIAFAACIVALLGVLLLQVSRYRDSASTAQKVREEETNGTSHVTEALKSETEFLGALTKVLFYASVAAVLIAGWYIVLAHSAR